MIAVDTNILVYAQRMESPWHKAADRCLTELAEGQAPWAIPWPCLHEFLAIVSNPGIWRPPTPMALAREQVESWMQSPSLVLLGAGRGHWAALQRSLRGRKMVGGAVHDARIAALCMEHNVSVLWTADRDFARFQELTVANPLRR